MDTAPILPFKTAPVKPAYLSVRLAFALYPSMVPPSVLATENEPIATPL